MNRYTGQIPTFMQPYLLYIFLICAPGLLWAQLDTRNDYAYQLNFRTAEVQIDGDANDPAWSTVTPASPMMNHWPTDTGQSQAKTEVKMTYDDEYLYFLAICHDTGDRIIQSLRRDDPDYWNNDNITLVIDPTNQKQNGFMYGLNAGGAQLEAQLNVNGVRTQYNENWDNRWYSSVKRYEAHWVAEMAIPLKTLRFKPGVSEWGFNVIRSDMGRNAYDTWTQFPVNFGGIDLNFMGTLEWDAAPPQAKGRGVLIPYVAGGNFQNFAYAEGEEASRENDLDVGVDAKIPITSSLNLDLTLNPDFSNVDVDQQVTNLTRFSILLPERRNFFLENDDVFSNFGGWEIQPFVSRRLGLIDGQQIPISYGGRLTGNLSNRLRIGAMNMQTQPFDTLAGQNYTIVSAHQQVLDRSVIKGIFINRSSVTSVDTAAYAQNAGLEFAYVSKDGKLNQSVRAHGANIPGLNGQNGYFSFDGTYNGRNLRSGWSYDVVGKNYITDLGFNPRLENFNAETEETVRIGYTRINPWILYRFYPEKGIINMHGARTWHMGWINHDQRGQLNERFHGFAYDIFFKNTSQLTLRMRHQNLQLPLPTSLLGSDFTPLPEDRYVFNRYDVFYQTDRRKRLNAEITAGGGNFYTGNIQSVSGSVNYRVQPWGSFGITYAFNDIDLGETYGRNSINIVRTNVLISFANNLFWTNALQYNSVSENVNYFSRFQWRFKPMSDLFIVYTDNYTSGDFTTKNRQVVFKLTYWLNL